MNKIIKIANGQGFWGDSSQAPIDLVEYSDIDYLTMDYLAEVTLSIMQKQKNKNPNAGYARDFILFLNKTLKVIKKKNIKIVTNAGGVNPYECRTQILKLAKDLGVDIKIAVISGDDIFLDLKNMLSKGISLNNLDTNKSIDPIIDDVCSANVYIDSFNIAKALELDADIVLTGRASDPGLVLGPCIHEFGWKKEDYDLLASGTVAGHIVECGAQCSGGNHSRWDQVEDLSNIGYPIVNIEANGVFTITKNNDFGGLIDKFTVCEQILYELGDPKNYISPDVVVDFTSINVENLSKNEVIITGVKGKAPTDTFKVSINYHKGYKGVGQLTISGPNAIHKAELIQELIWSRLSKRGISFEKKNVEYIGYNSCHRQIDSLSNNPSEIVVRLGVMDKNKDNINEFGKEIAPLITNGPPGVTGFSGGRPKAQEVIAYWPTLIGKDKIQTKVDVF